jgi:competence protein ComEC
VLALMIFSKPFVEWARSLSGDDLVLPQTRNVPLVKRASRRINRGFFDAFCVGIVAWIVSMPLIVFHFSQINPWAIVCGIILAPFVFASLIGGLAKLVLTLLWPSLSGAWAILAAAPIAAMRHVLTWLSHLPGSDFPIPAMPLWMLLLCYAFMLLWLVPMPRPKLKLLLRAAPVTACFIAILLPLRRVKSAVLPDELSFTLLSLGAGQCAVLETPSGRTILIDAGSSSMADVLGKAIGPYLRATQHASVDSMLLTHCDYDHISAAASIAQVYEVREVLTGSGFRTHARGNVPAEALLRTLESLDIPPRVVEPGQHIPLGRGAELEILWPPSNSEGLSSNDSAVVAQIRYAGRSILITGDIQDAAEAALSKSPQLLHADVLIAPHHGSSEATTEAFLRAVSPSSILSSNDRTLTGKQKRFDQIVGPSPLYRTNRCGAITVRISGEGVVRVEPFVPGSMVMDQTHRSN